MKKSILIVIAFLAIVGCKSAPESSDLPILSVSILPQEYFVKKIAGDYFSINVMIPPGASPATYEPTTGKLTSLSGTSLYLQMGYTGFEMAWMDKLSKSNPSMKLVNVSDGIKLITEASTHGSQSHEVDELNSGHSQQDSGHHHEDHLQEDPQHAGHQHGGIDPHVWLSPINAKIIAKNIEKALSESYPAQADGFKRNLGIFLEELDSLHQHILSEMAGVSSRSFFIYHPALTYFARDYQLEQFPLELGGKTPSPSHLKSLVDLGREKKISVVFLQMQFDQKNAEVLAREIDAEIVQINPLDPNWMDQMLFITRKLKENLQ